MRNLSRSRCFTKDLFRSFRGCSNSLDEDTLLGANFVRSMKLTDAMLGHHDLQHDRLLSGLSNNMKKENGESTSVFSV